MVLRRLAFALFTCILSLTEMFAQQPALTPEAALARVLQVMPAQADWFTSQFVGQVPTPKIDDIVKQYTGQFGAYRHVEGTPSNYTVYLERGTFPAKIALDADGRIAGLWFGLAEPLQGVSLDDSLAKLGKLPGKVSVTIWEDGKPRASLHPDDALAVGSAFKLAIMAAALDEAGSGKHPHDQVVGLRPEWKSLPSGVLQSWPDNMPITLATYASEMISISDNTAADAMLSIEGRDAVEKFAPHNRPFLSTREAFTLKSKANAALLTRYRAADEAGRRALLKEIDALPLPGADEFSGAPAVPDVEWFFTANELCALITRVADAPPMHINPGLARQEEWRQVAFKGGSEGGVLNLTSALTGRNGKHYCVAATWNNTAALSESDLFTPYAAVLSTLAKESAK